MVPWSVVDWLFVSFLVVVPWSVVDWLFVSFLAVWFLGVWLIVCLSHSLQCDSLECG